LPTWQRLLPRHGAHNHTRESVPPDSQSGKRAEEIDTDFKVEKYSIQTRYDRAIMSWVKTISELQQKARKFQEKQNVEAAEDAYNEALEALHEAEPGGMESVQAELAIRTDYGNFLRQLGESDRAIEQFEAALEALETVGADELALPRAGTILQLASVHVDAGRFEEAGELLEEVPESRLAEFDEQAGQPLISIDYYRLKGDVATRLDRAGAGRDAWKQGLDRVPRLIDVHPPSAVIYARMFLERMLSVTEGEESVDWWQSVRQPAREVTDSLAEHVELGAEGAGEQFVRLEMLLAEVSRRCGYMAKAEDAIWRAIEVDESWFASLSAVGAYSRLLCEDDERLEDGRLPRPEVEESTRELREHLLSLRARVGEGESSEFRGLVDAWGGWVSGDASITTFREKVEALGVELREGTPEYSLKQVLDGILRALESDAWK
jgi:tetratricopeptide (TPR) repeat protein